LFSITHICRRAQRDVGFCHDSVQRAELPSCSLASSLGFAERNNHCFFNDAHNITLKLIQQALKKDAETAT
jgi:hypothetical protein